MHEYSVVRALIDRVESEARARHGLRVRRVRVQVGELSGVDVGLLRTAYDACRAGTMCGDAAMDVVSVPIHWACTRCGGDVPPSGPRRCRACGAPAHLTHGGELHLERIELEVDDV
jgi:hydrogenase nickel incorporation protein HypA/HybF